MSKKYKLSLHIFRRDLRLHDNSALINALSDSEQVIPIFIFDPEQIGNQPYKSDHAIQFMVQSLDELDTALKDKSSQLYIFEGKAEKVISELIDKLNIEAIYINRDYTPFSIKRDKTIQKICNDNNIDFHVYNDALLNAPESILKKDGAPYVVYSAFYKFASQFSIDMPGKNLFQNYYNKAISLQNRQLFNKLLKNKNPSMAVKGGRIEARELLKKTLSHTPGDYDKSRDFPAVSGTSLLSAHNKFGTLSIREIYHAIAKQFNNKHTLIKELYWRDFFTHIAFHFPQVFGSAFHKKYNTIKWQNNEKYFKAWCEGKTGFPIVDAGMRELNATGYMHNRVRMITASFLCKDLHIDWRWGEKYFAIKLVDYDPSVNNGNWQWAASTGCDAQPYFRIFNPWLQQKKFDENAAYIKKWLPELEKVPAKIIHDTQSKLAEVADYPAPIIEHKQAAAEAKQLYKNA